MGELWASLTFHDSRSSWLLVLKNEGGVRGLERRRSAFARLRFLLLLPG